MDPVPADACEADTHRFASAILMQAVQQATAFQAQWPTNLRLFRYFSDTDLHLQLHCASSCELRHRSSCQLPIH